MRFPSFVIAVFVVLVAFIPASAADKPQWTAALEARLNEIHFRITQVSSDKIEVLIPGNKVLLKKDGIGMAVTVPGKLDLLDAMNVYKDGTAAPEFPAVFKHHIDELNRGRYAKAGEKVWITNITYKNDEMEVEIVSDPFFVPVGPATFKWLPYWSIIRFKTPKGQLPDGNVFFAELTDLFHAEDRSGTAYCAALKQLAASRPADSQATLFLPGATPPPQHLEPDVAEYHTETFALLGDETQKFHAFAQKCLPTFTVAAAPAEQQGSLQSDLSGSDPPYRLSMSVNTKKEGNLTSVVVVYRRWEDPSAMRLDYATIAYVQTASATCGWPFQTTEQKANADRFAMGTATWVHDEFVQANRHIDQKGRLDFCNDPNEKAKFDRLMPTVWPVGLVGKP